MGTNDHDRNRDRTGNSTPPPGQDHLTDDSHALRAGKSGETQRRQDVRKELPTRDEGRDDRRSGSDSNPS